MSDDPDTDDFVKSMLMGGVLVFVVFVVAIGENCYRDYLAHDRDVQAIHAGMAKEVKDGSGFCKK